MKRMAGPDFDLYRVDLEKMPKDHPFMKVNPHGAIQNATNGVFVFPFRIPSQPTAADRGGLLREPAPEGTAAYAATAPKATLYVRVIAASGGGWDHVSVSCADMNGRELTPTWAIMDWIKRRFFLPHEVAMQLHPAVADHISIHEHVLHLWRPHAKRIPLPPKRMV